MSQKQGDTPQSTVEESLAEEAVDQATDEATDEVTGQSMDIDGEYAKAMRDLIENKNKLMHEVERLGRQSADGLSEKTNRGEGDAFPNDAGKPAGESVGDSGDSGHIADIISEDGEEVSGAVIWSNSGRKFVLMSVDGHPINDLEADQATKLINDRRIAFDGAKEQEYFVSKMSSAGVDVDRDRIDVSTDGSTGELLVMPENLIGNERHHISKEHAGENAEWTDEVDLSDPESTGPQRVEEILASQGRQPATSKPGKEATPASKAKKVSGTSVYRMDILMTFLTVLVIVIFYLLVLVFQQPSSLMLNVWSILCVTCTASVLFPFTTSIETREKNIGSKFMLTGTLCVMFALMSVCLVADIITNRKVPWGATGEVTGETVSETEEPEAPVILDFEPSGDIITLEMTGSTKSYSTVAIGDVLVTTSEAGHASSLVANIGGKKYATQTIATIDGMGVSVFTVESIVSPHPVRLAKSLTIGEKVIVYSTGENGSVSVEGATIRSTTFPIGTKGLPESSEVDKVFIDRKLLAGDIVMDEQGQLIGIAAADGDSVVTGTSISKAVNVLTSDNENLYIGVICRQASVSENEDGGAYVENVMTNSPASNAGIMTGDIIVSVDDNEIDGTDDLDSRIERHNAGEQVTLGIIRDKSEIEIAVTIGRHGVDGNASGSDEDDESGDITVNDTKGSASKPDGKRQDA